MKTLTLMTLSLLLSAGCAREAAPVNTAKAPAGISVAQAKTLGFPSCATEDSCGCYWDAAARGNGRGTSFVAAPCTVAKLDAELAAFCAGPEGPGDHVCEQRAKEDPVALEELCMTVAERAYERAAGYAMTSLGDAPVPDAAYEDAYAACTEGR